MEGACRPTSPCRSTSIGNSRPTDKGGQSGSQAVEVYEPNPTGKCTWRSTAVDHFSYDVMPLVSAMKAVSRLISSSLSMVSLCPALTSVVAKSL
jgi:hypothetical protein